jgi:hypothetical protein
VRRDDGEYGQEGGKLSFLIPSIDMQSLCKQLKNGSSRFAEDTIMDLGARQV